MQDRQARTLTAQRAARKERRGQLKSEPAIACDDVSLVLILRTQTHTHRPHTHAHHTRDEQHFEWEGEARAPRGKSVQLTAQVRIIGTLYMLHARSSPPSPISPSCLLLPFPSIYCPHPSSWMK